MGDKLQGGEGRETSQEVSTAIQGEMMEFLERVVAVEKVGSDWILGVF